MRSAQNRGIQKEEAATFAKTTAGAEDSIVVSVCTLSYVGRGSVVAALATGAVVATLLVLLVKPEISGLVL